MLEVGARSKGQASLSTPVEILISVLLAIVDSVGPVKEKILHPIFFKEGIRSIISFDSPECEKIKTLSFLEITPISPWSASVA